MTFISIPLVHHELKKAENKDMKSPQEVLSMMKGSELSLSSSTKTNNIANTLLNNYANCSTFRLCNDNDVFTNQMNDQNQEKEFGSLMMLNTPPSNANKPTKYVVANSTNNRGAIFSCTPYEGE